MPAREGNVVPGVVWTQLECHIGLIVSCFPALNGVYFQLKQRILSEGRKLVTGVVFKGTRRTDAEAQAGAELYFVNVAVDAISPVTESQEWMVPEALGSGASTQAMDGEASMEVVIIEHVELGKMC